MQCWARVASSVHHCVQPTQVNPGEEHRCNYQFREVPYTPSGRRGPEAHSRALASSRAPGSSIPTVAHEASPAGCAQNGAHELLQTAVCYHHPQLLHAEVMSCSCLCPGSWSCQKALMTSCPGNLCPACLPPLLVTLRRGVLFSRADCCPSFQGQMHSPV